MKKNTLFLTGILSIIISQKYPPPTPAHKFYAEAIGFFTLSKKHTFLSSGFRRNIRLSIDLSKFLGGM
jgi:hypothetical protein